MKKMILISGNTISGAEIVLKNFLEKTTKEFIILTSKTIYETNFFELPNTEVIFLEELEFLGSSKLKSKIKKVVLQIKKIKNIILVGIKLKKIIKDKNISTIILNNTADIVYLTCFKYNIKVISYIHDILEKKEMLSFFLQLNEKKISNYITVSKATKERLIDLKIDEKKIYVVYNGVLVKESLKKKVNNSFLFVGMINDRKNPLEFLEFLEKVQKKVQNYSAKIIYKYYEEELLEKLKKIVNEKKLNVSFLFSLTQIQVEEEMQKANYLFLCSKKDPLPTVILEAMNNSMIVISRNVDGVPEMVKNRINGYLYSDKIEWNEIILDIIDMEQEKYREIVLNSNMLLKNNFDNNMKVKVLEKII